jgi:drug/metabolite transporter (DMT)-like permease
MLRNRRLRRVLGATLLLAGALLMLFSPSVEIGLMAFALGVVLELAGLALERRDRP